MGVAGSDWKFSKSLLCVSCGEQVGEQEEATCDQQQAVGSVQRRGAWGWKAVEAEWPNMREMQEGRPSLWLVDIIERSP